MGTELGTTGDPAVPPDGATSRTGSCGSSVSVWVMSGFEVWSGGERLFVTTTVERILAFLTVRQKPQLRSTIASTLWMDTTTDRSFANLRTALWRTRQAVGDALVLSGQYVGLSSEVRTDLDDVVVRARRLISDAEPLDPSDEYPGSLCGDLLPGWDEEWITFERERLRQLRIHALEALCKTLSAADRPGEAVDAGLAAVEAEPLRESAQRVLAAAHLAEGNVSEARRQFHIYRDLLWDALGIEPSDAFQEMVGLAPSHV